MLSIIQKQPGILEFLELFSITKIEPFFFQQHHEIVNRVHWIQVDSDNVRIAIFLQHLLLDQLDQRGLTGSCRRTKHNMLLLFGGVIDLLDDI